MLGLDTLTDELHQLGASKQDFASLSASALSGCAALRALPRYRDGNVGLQRLFSDLQLGIDSLFDAEDRKIARVHFRLEQGGLQYMARHRTLRTDDGDDTTATRRRAENKIEPRLAFYLFELGTEWEQPYARLDYGFRAIEHDWTLTVDPSDHKRETMRQIVKARCVRPGQRFYVFGADDEGASRESVRVVSKDPRHVLVGGEGVVPLDPDASNDYLIVVYLGRDYATNDIVTTGIERVTLEPRPLKGSNLFITPVGEMERARLTIDAPREMVPRVSLVERDLSAPWTPVDDEGGVQVERNSDEPVVFPVPKPEIGYRYEIAWKYSA